MDEDTTKMLLLAVSTMLDKLNEHNPETGYLFAIDHGLTSYLTMLTLAYAAVLGAVTVERATAYAETVAGTNKTPTWTQENVNG